MNMPEKTAIDLLLYPDWIVPVVPAGKAMENHAVAVKGGRIFAIVEQAVATDLFEPAKKVDLAGHVLIPGLINTHTHAGMALLRGIADDLPLMPWLQDHIWPAETHFMSPEFVQDGSELAIAEMIRSGTTCFNDMYFFPDVTAGVARHVGMRACVGLIVIDFPTAWARDPDEYIDKALEIHDRWQDDALVRTCWAPHAPYTVGDELLQHVRVLADQLDMRITMHVQETESEVEQSVEQCGLRPLARLEQLGLLNDVLIAVHMTQVTDAEVEACAAAGVAVVHCPESNMKLASGHAPVVRMRNAGIGVSLGTDGAASNNDLNMFGEMRSAALLAKSTSGDAAALPAAEVLRMATLDGAKVLGMEREVGSLEAGKQADMVAVKLDMIESVPIFDPISHLVYCAGREQVTGVWVAGKPLLEQGRLTSMEEAAIVAKARQWGQRIGEYDAARKR